MVTTTLSTLDGGAPRVYIRYALTFACNAIQAVTASDNLPKAVKSLVNEIPMLAGCVTTTNGNKPTVAFTLEQVENFRASITHLENTRPPYSTIRQRGIPPVYISGTDVTPLEDAFNDSDTNPACAIQANFITGGLILVIFLHHAIADIRGINTIIELMSEGLTKRTLDQETLDHEALSASEARAHLSNGYGAPPFLSFARDVQTRLQQNQQQRDQPDNDSDSESDASDCSSGSNTSPNVAAVLRFKLSKLLYATGLLNDRPPFHHLAPKHTIELRDTLIAILWRAYVRARWPAGADNATTKSSVSFPIDIRNHLLPALGPRWMGNAEVAAIANEQLLRLGLPWDVSPLHRTAKIVHESATNVATDLLARSRINLMNTIGDAQESLDAELVVHDWTPFPTGVKGQETDLGLKIGKPEAIRRTGRSIGANEMVLLPPKEPAGVWEVQVELPRDVLDRMLQDEYLLGFLWGVAQ